MGETRSPARANATTQSDVEDQVHDVRRLAHAEECADEPAHDAGGRRPEPTHSSSAFATEHQVDGIGAHEQAERQQGRVARQAEEQRDAQGEPEEREGHERHDLSGVGLSTRTGIVIGEAPNPVMPNTRYATKITPLLLNGRPPAV